ncbi:MAG: peptidylprolyl isomerase [Gemmatimonas sp.]
MIRFAAVALFAMACPSPMFAQSEAGSRPAIGDTVTTPTGLRYLFAKQGSGPKPETGSVMSIHGIGRFTDGREFWNTRTENAPYQYRLGVDRVIRGFEEGMREVREGDRIIIFMKPELAYGARGNRDIPPNTALVFDYEILSVKPFAPGGASRDSTSSTSPQPGAGRVPIRIETQYGNIEAYLDSGRAPITVTNFLHYVDGHLYDSASFFRTVTLENQPNDSVKIQVIQGGKARSKQGFPEIPLERTNVTGLTHVNGTLSMARSGPDTGTDQFSIMIGDQPALDFGGKRNKDGQGFAAFGQVTSGWDVIKKIQAQPANGQYVTMPVTILKIVRR